MTTILIRLRLGWLLLPLLAAALNTSAQQNTLDKYVDEGLSNNLLIKQKNVDIKKARYALQIAESLFFPTVNFEASYQSGAGGRSINFRLVIC
jgi:outer membrane protein